MATKTTTTRNARDVASEIAYLARALKAPTLAGAVTRDLIRADVGDAELAINVEVDSMIDATEPFRVTVGDCR